jgi:hypothetical protein
MSRMIYNNTIKLDKLFTLRLVSWDTPSWNLVSMLQGSPSYPAGEKENATLIGENGPAISPLSPAYSVSS